MNTQQYSFTVLDFGALARQVGLASAALGLRAPAFRSPAQLPHRTRTVRRFTGGGGLVSITTKGRARQEIVDDMIEGVVVVNGLRGGTADAVRRTLQRQLFSSAGSRAA